MAGCRRRNLRDVSFTCERCGGNMRIVSCIAASAMVAIFWAATGSALADTSDQPTIKKTTKASKREARPAKPAEPAPNAMTTPTMVGPLAANPHPFSFDPGFLGSGPVYVTGAISGLGLVQSNHFPTDHEFVPSLSNAQVFIQKTDGVVQYFVQAGAYTIPALGTPYFNTAKYTNDFYGPVPVGFVKLVPNSNFSVMAGQLPTLIGAEYTFTFENMNIQRGLLWNQENAINRGVQANYTAGPVVFSLSLNDGFYSNRYSWLSGSATWTIDSANTLSFVGGGNTSQTSTVTLVTPIQNNQQIFNLIYTYNSAPWTITPYVQATHVPANPSAGVFHDASTLGGAILANYSFPTQSFLRGVSLPVRLEYITSTGSAANGAPSLIYGPGSSAWSVTVTPTYQIDKYFVRAEVSYVEAMNTTPGAAFGLDGNAKSQVRGALEFGILF